MTFKLLARNDKVLCSLAIFAIFFLTPEITFAEGQEEDVVDDFEQVMATATSFVYDVIQPILWTVISFIGGLLDNSMIFGDGMENILRKIWVEIRNLVNIAFVLILLVIALYNVFGRSEGNFVLKTILPKFVVALILVNFSFFIGKVVIDVSHAATQLVFSLPQQVYSPSQEVICYKSVPPENPNAPSTDPKSKWTLKSFPCIIPTNTENVLIEAKKPDGYPADEDPNCKSEDGFYQLEHNKYVVIKKCKKVKMEDFQGHQLAYIMAYNLFSLQDIPETAQTEGDYSTISLESFFSILFLLLYGTAFIAMFIVLVARVAVLWLTLILSPVVAIFYVMGDVLPPPENFDIQKMFLEHAFVPVKMALPITIGFIMVVQGRDVMVTQTEFGAYQVKDILTTFKQNISGVGDMRLILWNITIVAAIWMGVFAAANKTVVSGLVESFKNIALSAGKYIAQAPLLATVIPAAIVKPLAQAAGASEEELKKLDQEKGVSPLTLLAAGRQGLEAISPLARGRERAQHLFPALYGGSAAVSASQDLRSAKTSPEIANALYRNELRILVTPEPQKGLAEALRTGDTLEKGPEIFGQSTLLRAEYKDYNNFLAVLGEGNVKQNVAEEFITKYKNAYQNTGSTSQTPPTQPPAQSSAFAGVTNQTTPADTIKVVIAAAAVGDLVNQIDKAKNDENQKENPTIKQLANLGKDELEAMQKLVTAAQANSLDPTEFIKATADNDTTKQKDAQKELATSYVQQQLGSTLSTKNDGATITPAELPNLDQFGASVAQLDGQEVTRGSDKFKLKKSGVNLELKKQP